MNFQALESWGAEFSAETDANLSSLAGDITTLDGSLTSLSGDVATLDSGLTVLSDDLTTLDGVVTAIDSAVGDLEAESLFRSTGFCHVANSSALTVPTATTTAPDYGIIVTDEDYWWNAGVYGVEYIVPTTPGIYSGGFWFNFSGGGFAATDRIVASVAINGTGYMDIDRPAGTASPSIFCPLPPYPFNGSTTRLSGAIWHNSGADRAGDARLWLEYKGSG
jgi:hypothetical protein